MAHQQQCPKWERAMNGNVPANAVEMGKSAANNEVMFVGRAQCDGEMVPGKVVPSHKCIYVGNNMKEHGEKVYEVLVNCGNCKLVWLPAENGQVPAGAIEAGKTKGGEPLYIGRGHPPPEPRGLHGGKVHPSQGCIWIPFNGTEHQVKKYEVLCQQYLFA